MFHATRTGIDQEIEFFFELKNTGDFVHQITYLSVSWVNHVRRPGGGLCSERSVGTGHRLLRSVQFCGWLEKRGGVLNPTL